MLGAALLIIPSCREKKDAPSCSCQLVCSREHSCSGGLEGNLLHAAGRPHLRPG